VIGSGVEVAIDWNGVAKLLERQDGGSELYVEFRELSVAPLVELVGRVVEMDPAERARMVIDAGSAGMFSQAEIFALAGRADFPA
jgi:hypothetical protein